MVFKLPKAAMLETKVMVTLRLRFPRRRMVQKLDAPPPGQHATTNRLSFNAGPSMKAWHRP